MWLHVVAPPQVKELDASVHFYVNVMGMEMIPRPKFGVPGAWVHGHGTAIHLVQSSDTDLRQQVRDRRKGEGFVGGASVCFGQRTWTNTRAIIVHTHT